MIPNRDHLLHSFRSTSQGNCDTPEAEPFIFGFDPSINMAWKIEVADPAQNRVYANRIDVLPDSQPSDSVWAHWQDGTSHRVEQLTVEEWQSKQPRQGATHWQRDHSVTGHKLRIAVRPQKDRDMLVGLYDQSKMVHCEKMHVTLKNNLKICG